jgi:hypothetical protein
VNLIASTFMAPYFHQSSAVVLKMHFFSSYLQQIRIRFLVQIYHYNKETKGAI